MRVTRTITYEGPPDVVAKQLGRSMPDGVKELSGMTMRIETRQVETAIVAAFYYADETGALCGPFKTADDAEKASVAYAKWLKPGETLSAAETASLSPDRDLLMAIKHSSAMHEAE